MRQNCVPIRTIRQSQTQRGGISDAVPTIGIAFLPKPENQHKETDQVGHIPGDAEYVHHLDWSELDATTTWGMIERRRLPATVDSAAHEIMPGRIYT